MSHDISNIPRIWVSYIKPSDPKIRHNLVDGLKLVQLVGCILIEEGSSYLPHNVMHGFIFGIVIMVWESKRQVAIRLFKAEAKYVATILAAKEGLWINTVIKQLDFLKLMKRI